MKILHLINTIDPAFGGPVEAARQFAAAARDGITVEVLTLDADVSKWIESWPVAVHTLGKSLTRYRYNPRLVPWLRKNAHRFDAVVVHGIWHYQTVAAWQGLRCSGVPYFVIPHGMLNRWFKEAHPVKHLKKLVFWHTMVHEAVQGAAAVLFLCDRERQSSLSAFAIRSRGEALVPLGIDPPPPPCVPSPTDFGREFPDLEGKRIFLFLGRICRMKACDSLLRAFADVCRLDSACHLMMCGPDFEGWQAELVHLAEHLKIAGHVTWTGPLYGDKKWCTLRAAELFVLPSHCETFPVAVLEALACHTPVLISDQVGIYPEIIAGKAGLLCKDEELSIAGALRSWLCLDFDQRAGYRSAAYQCFQDRFQLRSALERQIDVIRRFSHSRTAQPVPAET